MRICSFCGSQNGDDSHFCVECGKPLSQGSICPNCGGCLNDGDVFCQNCGKRLDGQTKTSSIESPKRICSNCGASLDKDDVYCPSCGKKHGEITPSIETDVENNACEVDKEIHSTASNTTKITEDSVSRKDILEIEEGYNPWKEYRIHIIGGILVALLLGGCWWYYKTSTDRVENDKAIQQESQKLALQREKEKLDSIENAQKEELLFLENFYKELEEYSDSEVLMSYIRKKVTDKALKTLKDEYDYDCEDGECLATWLFSYEAGTDLDSLYDRKIEPVAKNTFLVTSTWGYSDGSYSPSDYRVRLGVVKEGASYKIDKIVNVNEEERKKQAQNNARDSKQANSTNTVSQQDFNEELMKRVKEIQRIMGRINSIYNRFIMNGGTNQHMGVNAIATISDLRLEGEEYFDEIISLARKEGKQELIPGLRQEKKDFVDKAFRMESSINSIIYNL